ncbi:hypothetical protein CONPUDRAFT_80914 [Coniophora puteana RWD-64-598 SS2]|uniref:Uncharacterized protein n=1 Tax=Coniophora puteana (strain RWD-64-598) TaxID=741705 RepID=A0A5M3MU17_CONPW|nr:uncharacterized protein CONPUDRAFT_80914 [Coniophora puteana RWD-64-598 SS2]EIW82652.1 hypothetical protein CONPUDRAFT_80914 [Coniophora puteana RWD-64-598 SS2]
MELDLLSSILAHDTPPSHPRFTVPEVTDSPGLGVLRILQSVLPLLTESEVACAPAVALCHSQIAP